MKIAILLHSTRLAPILGGGVALACPLCWAGSAALITYLGPGAIVALWWRWIALSFLGLAVIGFALDYRLHRNPVPLILLILGGALLYTKSFVLGAAGFAGWQIWVPGGIAVIAAIIENNLPGGERDEDSLFASQRHCQWGGGKSPPCHDVRLPA